MYRPYRDKRLAAMTWRFWTTAALVAFWCLYISLRDPPKSNRMPPEGAAIEKMSQTIKEKTDAP